MEEKIIIQHENYMQRCFQLAKLGDGFVEPNPMVGAVLVYEDKIIGEGYHQQYGEAHAEVNCIHSVKKENEHLISKSTLYVSLEPCAHFGKTPPCVDLIIKHNIKKVVISVEDKFYLVDGKGIQKLRENNIEVIAGILEKEGKYLLKHFLYFHQYKKPYITLKFAQSKDGFIGMKDKETFISNELSKRYVHKLRAQHQSILVGKTTVKSDNSELTVRYWNGKNPIRIVLGNKDLIPKEYNIFNNEAETIFLNDESSPLTVYRILEELSKRNIISVLIEGGANVLQQFINTNAWNEAHVITSGEVFSQQSTVNSQQFIKAPVITGIQQDYFSLEENTVQILKNPNDLFIA